MPREKGKRYGNDLHFVFDNEYYAGYHYFVNGGKICYRSFGIPDEAWQIYMEIDDKGYTVDHFKITTYANYDHENNTWGENTYAYYNYNDDIEREITNAEYDEWSLFMLNDDEIKWNDISFGADEHTGSK